MSDAPSVTPEALQQAVRRQFAQALEEAARSRFDERDDALQWFALAPGWTAALAQACAFPAGDEDAEAFFERLVGRGDAERRRTFDETLGAMAPETFYVMAAPARAAVLEGAGSPNAPDPRRTVAEISQRMLRAPERMPPALRAWARLAAEAAAPQAWIASFEHGVRQAFASADSAALLEWIDAARPLAALARRQLDARPDEAVQRAGRHLELLHRRQIDEEHLRYFLRRDDQVVAVKHLLAGSDDDWALHVIGAGGVGKTMLVRYTTVQLGTLDAQRSDDFRGLDIAAARVDFDYLGADYPTLAPGLLLWAFAQDLRAFDRGSAASELFDAAGRLFDEVQQSLLAGGARATSPSEHPLFEAALGRYADGLLRLERRVLLIVDTCEELGRLRPGGTPLPNVEETFRILERLHARVPSLRVLFSGRRALAGAGRGWQCTAAAALPARPYLGLHQLRGFTHGEAREYLAQAKAPPALVNAIIAGSSPDAASAVTIIWDDPGRRPPEGPRCNPYELRLHLEWAREDPPPSAQELANASSDQYVELRIVRRLRDEMLQAALPLLALLGHVDRAILAAVWDERGAELFERLALQEWTGLRERNATDGPGDAVLDVEAGVRRRLRAYFARRGLALGDARERAAAHLERRTLEAPLERLGWTDADATLGALEHDGARARRWWAAFEARLFAQRDAAWIVHLVEPLLGADGACGIADAGAGPDVLPPHELRPFVLATLAAAQAHDGRARFAQLNWETVRAACLERTGDAWDALALRALAAEIALRWRTGQAIDGADAEQLWRTVATMGPPDSAAALAALVAGVEALVERAERPLEPDGRVPLDAVAWIRLVDRLLMAATPLDPEPLAMACALGARLLAQGADKGIGPRGIESALERALDLAERVPPPAQRGPASRWPDWLAPADIASRLRLEALRLLPAATRIGRRQIVAWVAPLGPAPDADAERLQSRLLAQRLEDGPVALDELAMLGWRSASPGELAVREDWPAFRGLRHAAHLETLPLAVSVARAYGALGQPEAAWRQLTAMANLGRWRDAVAGPPALAEQVRLVLRYRLDDRLKSVPEHEQVAAWLTDDEANAFDQLLAPGWAARRAPADAATGVGLPPQAGSRAFIEGALLLFARLGVTQQQELLDRALRALEGLSPADGDALQALSLEVLRAWWGDEQQRVQARERLPEAYARVAASSPYLPPWPMLLQLARTADVATIEALGPPGWQPWLARTVAALVPDEPGASLEFEGWLAARYALALPPEWAAWVARRAPPPFPPPRAAPAAAAAPASRWRRTLGTASTVVFGLVVWVGFYFGFDRGVGWLVPAFGTLAVGWKIAWFLGVILMIGVVASTLAEMPRSLAAWRAALARYRLIVRAADDGPDLRWQCTPVRLARHGRVDPGFPWWPLDEAAPQQVAGGPVVTRPGENYSRTADALPPSVVAAFRGALRAARPRPINLEIAIQGPPAMQAPAWEAALLLAAGIEPAEARPPMRRTVPLSPSARHPVRPDLLRERRLFVLADDELARALARAVWPEGTGLRLLADLERDDTMPDGTAPPLVLHLVGAVELTSVGLRLRALERPASRSSTGPLREWSAADLAQRRPALCILQPPPRALPGTRLASELEAAGLTREFAAELAAAGVAWVVVLPSLPAERMADGLGSLVRVLGRSGGGLGAWICNHLWREAPEPGAALDRALLRWLPAARAEIALGVKGMADPADVAGIAYDTVLFRAEDRPAP